MKVDKQSTVLVCVTGQYDCDRLIRTGHEIAVQKGYALKVLSILKPIKDYSVIGSEFEYLHHTAAKLDSDITILFSENAPEAAAEYAKSVRTKEIVAGMYDEGEPDSFLFKFNQLEPNIGVSIVTKENYVHKIEPIHVSLY